MTIRPESPAFTVALSIGGYWDLDRQGPSDQQRFDEKTKEGIRGQLPQIITNEQIVIGGDGGQKVRVRLGGPELSRFRYDPGQQKMIGQGSGDSKPGDFVAPGPGKDGGGSPGEEPGVETYEVEITLEELMRLAFEDLGLPNLQPKKQVEVESGGVAFDDVRKRGILPNLDKKRTVKEAIKRRALEGDPHFKNVKQEDLRFKTWHPAKRKASNAVILAMMDVSGSMGEFEKYIARSFYWWLMKFLRRKYDQAKIVFIAHHTEAKEVNEQKFFHRAESGGTKISSAYQLALDIIGQRFPPKDWNIYPFHFSDGENIPWDNDQAAKLMGKLVECSSAAGYGEIRRNAGSDLGRLMASLTIIKDPRFRASIIAQKEDVWPALRNFLSQEGVEGWVSRA